MRQLIGIFILSLALASPAFAKREFGPVVESVEGVAVLQFLDASTRQLKKGEQLAYGDKFRTAPNGTFRIAFEDGSQILVAGDTAFKLAKNKHKVSIIDLDSGDIKIMIPEEPEPKEKKSKSSSKSKKFERKRHAKPYALYVMSRPLSMGAGPGEFVVNTNGEITTVTTLEGLVTASDELKGLNKKKKSVTIAGGQSLKAEFNKPLEATTIILKEDFQKEYYSKLPKMKKLSQAARSAEKKRTMDKRFEKIYRDKEAEEKKKKEEAEKKKRKKKKSVKANSDSDSDSEE